MIVIYYLIRKNISFKDQTDCIPEGFKAMVAAILILTLAWTIKTMTDSLGAADFVAELVKSGAESFMNFLAGGSIPCRLRTGICHRNIMGYIRSTYPYRYGSI